MMIKMCIRDRQYTNESMLEEIYHYVQQYHAFYYGDEKRFSSTVNHLLRSLQTLKQTTVSVSYTHLYYAALTNMRSVGVMGDERTYDYAVALRAVTTTDFMTAESYNMPWDVLGTVTSRIVNEVKHVNRVFYDCTGKPPATIELE